MGKKDEVKAKISFFQTIIAIIISTLFAIFGYTAIHYKEFDLILIISTILASLFLMIMLGIFVKFFLKYVKKLRGL